MTLRQGRPTVNLPGFGPVTDDAFLGGRLRIYQPVAGFRAAVDSVVLGAAAGIEDGERCLDAGAGAGVAGLVALVHTPSARILGVEVEPDVRALHVENARRNGFADRVESAAADIFALPVPFAGGPFDHVLTNPPYYDADTASAPPDRGKARAYLLDEGRGLDAWLARCVDFLCEGGALTAIVPASRMQTALTALTPALGDLVIYPIWPHAGRAAKRVIVQGRKGAQGPTRMLAGLVLHDPPARYTTEAEAVLRHGAPIRLDP